MMVKSIYFLLALLLTLSLSDAKWITPTGVTRMAPSLTSRHPSNINSGASYALNPNNNKDVVRQAINNGDSDVKSVRMCSGQNTLLSNLVRGALLRIASDISGGTPLESIKCRVTISNSNFMKAYREIIDEGGFLNLWAGTPSRTVEGALLGAVFMVGSVATKRQVLAMGGSKTVAALAGGLVGGVAQSVVMTPAGMIFTSLNSSGDSNENAISITRRIIKEKGIAGMFVGMTPMAVRQASNWASRGMFTEIARTTFGFSKYGVLGEIGSGVVGGVGSCWNTPVETVRVIMQRDVSQGKPPKTFKGYVDEVVEEGGVQSLFRGVTPRGIQAIWQTVFMVVVPNMLGM